jgi:L-fuculose-phosphate aldolase
MAYATTTAVFDTHTIPESYILLREIPSIPFQTLYTDPHTIAETISEQSPVAITQNDCVLVAGNNILTVFDRLEVAEFSARSLIDTAVLGPLNPIGNSEIEDLIETFLS